MRVEITRSLNIRLFPVLCLAFMLDAWLLGSLAAYFQATGVAFRTGHLSSPDLSYFFSLLKNPLFAAWETLRGFLGVSPFPVKTWLFLNLCLLVIVTIMSLKGGKLALLPGNSIRFTGRTEKGSASWLSLSEMAKKFKFSYDAPGILLGKIKVLFRDRPVIMPVSPIDNRNVAVFGPSGSGKSRGYIRNNLFHAVRSGWSVIITDSKGELTRDFRKWFEKEGYTVRVFNLVSMLHSDRWNPLDVVKSDIDAQLFTEVVIANTAVPGRKGGDPFWDRAEMNLLKALTLYVVNELPKKDRNLGMLYRLLASGDPETMNSLFSILPDDHPAKLPWNIFCETAGQVRSGMIIGLGSRLQVFQNQLVQELTAVSDIDLELPGKEKCAYFCILSDTDSTFDFLASLFFSFLFIKLVRLADSKGGALDVPVNFLLDEFVNVGHIPDFTKKLATVRSRGIGCSIVFQTLSQLENKYPGEWETVLGNCDTWVVLGARDLRTAAYIEKVLGTGTIEVESISRERTSVFDLGRETVSPAARELLQASELLRLKKDDQIVLTAYSKPAKLKKLDYTEHPYVSGLEPQPVSEYLPGWAEEWLAKRQDVQKAGQQQADSAQDNSDSNPAPQAQGKPARRRRKRTKDSGTVVTDPAPGLATGHPQQGQSSAEPDALKENTGNSNDFW